MEPHEHPAFASLIRMCAPWNESSVIHGFLGRTGGVSRGAYSSLNLGQFVGDDPAAVAENYRRVRAALGAEAQFARVNQVHGAGVKIVTDDNADERPSADAMATREAGVMLAIFTADCVPILMRSRGTPVVAAIHAGWRGALAGVALAGVAAMENLGASVREIEAALGPSIGLCCFEVDEDLAERFARQFPGARRHRRAGRPGKAHLDLRGILRDQLIAAGVGADTIQAVGPCTRCASDRFFSRRAAGGISTGLQMSFIGIAEG